MFRRYRPRHAFIPVWRDSYSLACPFTDRHPDLKPCMGCLVYTGRHTPGSLRRIVIAHG